MPVLISCSGILIFLMTVVLMFCNFGNEAEESSRKRCSCCGQTCFLFFGALLILPLVIWTAIVVFMLGYPSEKSPDSDLQCDPKFWKAAFWILIALIVFSFIIIVTIIVSCCKKFCACCANCCSACCTWFGNRLTTGSGMGCTGQCNLLPISCREICGQTG